MEISRNYRGYSRASDAPFRKAKFPENQQVIQHQIQGIASQGRVHRDGGAVDRLEKRAQRREPAHPEITQATELEVDDFQARDLWTMSHAVEERVGQRPEEECGTTDGD